MGDVRAAAWVLATALVAVPLVQPGGLLGADLSLAASSLSVSGSVQDVQPGVPAQLLLTVRNDDADDRVLRRLSATVVGGGVPGCPADALHVTPWSGRVTVPGGGSATQALSVVLDPGVQCAAVTWDLRYTAQGE